jgi:rhamnosyltransferase
VKVAAVIVLFEPDDGLAENVDACRAEVDVVLAIDNTPRPNPSVAKLMAERGVQYRPLNRNRGLAAALNVGCRWAQELGFEWVLTLDQDSTVTPGMVSLLCECVEPGHNAQDQSRPYGSAASRPCQDLPEPGRVAIVAPIYQQVGGLPVLKAPGCLKIDESITSGSLTRLSALANLGWFREDLFIDRVDTEYCMRAQSHGWQILQRRDALLIHRMGHLRQVRCPVKCFVTDYPPIRRYYMVRNVLELRRLYGKRFPAWIERERQWWLRELVKVLLFEHQRRAKALMMLQGWRDYRLTRLGSYECIHKTGRGTARWRRRTIR